MIDSLIFDTAIALALNVIVTTLVCARFAKEILCEVRKSEVKLLNDVKEIVEMLKK